MQYSIETKLFTFLILNARYHNRYQSWPIDIKRKNKIIIYIQKKFSIRFNLRQIVIEENHIYKCGNVRE